MSVLNESMLTKMLTLAAEGEHAVVPVAQPAEGLGWAGLILALPMLSLILCGVWAAMKIKNKLPAITTAACLAGSFFVTLALYLGYEGPVTIHIADWFMINTGGGPDPDFVANFSLYVDQLTLLWMLFVTGLGTLIAIYASEYMEPDVGKGYARFFAGVSVFLFAMCCLVMGDNLVMLYLGWEGVGFASYWLIGYYYTKPEAVAAAKKAFIVNRIGDLGLALGLYLTWHAFGTVEYAELFRILNEGGGPEGAGGWQVTAIPYLLMLGAFGKSAQLPLYVWLPDAMEGPTPVSALIHAATMVTAGVYLIARMYPVFLLNPESLNVVAWVGGLTALLAATIGMAQYDIKRIMAYSTVSQLGYMFMGLGVLTTFGGAYHVFTHAFFKAVLFLTCGAIMHGFAGQLDLRKLSGLRHMKGWKIVSWTMLIGCLCLAGFPGTSGFFSKDAILAEAFVHGETHLNILGWIAIFTAGLTAYYTFRVWFRVCAGKPHFEMGDDHHGDDDHGHGDHDDHGHGHDQPHAPRLAINAVLVIIAAGALLAAVPFFTGNEAEGVHGGWVADMVHGSSAAAGLPHAHEGDHHVTTFLGGDPHKLMYFVSGAVGLIGIAVAFFLHLMKRDAADSLRAGLLGNPLTRWLPTAMENKWYVDEFYDWTIRKPLWWLGGQTLYLFDRFLIDMLIVDTLFGKLPRAIGKGFQPLHNGILQSYAVTMAGGVALVTVLVLAMPQILEFVRSFSLTGLFGGGAG